MFNRAKPERLSIFSDAVFAVLITILVLGLRPPESPTFTALLSLWHTWLSYAISYLFIAIVWTNHHYLMRFAKEATPLLVWLNFLLLFSASLLPFSTAWMAVSQLAPQPVAFYAAVFSLVNATYIALIWEIAGPSADGISARTLKDKLLHLEARQQELAAILAMPGEARPLIHPALATIYRRKVADLHSCLTHQAYVVFRSHDRRRLLDPRKLCQGG